MLVLLSLLIGVIRIIDILLSIFLRVIPAAAFVQFYEQKLGFEE